MARINLARTTWLLLAVAASAIAASACGNSVGQAEPADRDAVVGKETSTTASEQAGARCWPGLTIAGSGPGGDAVEWVTKGDGTLSVRRWSSRSLKTYSAEQCGDAPAGSLIRAETSRRLVWEKVWPDAFRDDAVRLGWPAWMVDRCTELGPDSPLEHLIFGQCGTMEQELFLEPLDLEVRVPPEDLQRGPFITRAAALGRWEARQISYCADLIFAPSRPRAWDEGGPAPSSRDCLAVHAAARAQHASSRS